MALTLNGTTNTIGGLAVGGLPDGIVDTDMLAANAVATAKIAAAAVTAAKRGSGAILNISSMTLTSDSNYHINNTTGDAGSETTIVRKSASSNFIIYIATNVYRSSNNGIGTLGYKRAINSGSYSADQQMLRATDADRSVMAIRSYIDTTTGSVGDTVKITARYANDQSQNDNVRNSQTMIMEFEP